MMRTRSGAAVEPGLRFRAVSAGPFAHGSRVWRVVGLRRGPDGREVAAVVAADDRTVAKTLSVDALLDRRLYTLLGRDA